MSAGPVIARPPMSEWGRSEARVQSAINSKAKDGVLDARDAEALKSRFLGTKDEFMFRYGLSNVVSSHYSAYTSINLPKGACITQGALDILGKVADHAYNLRKPCPPCAE